MVDFKRDISDETLSKIMGLIPNHTAEEVKEHIVEIVDLMLVDIILVKLDALDEIKKAIDYKEDYLPGLSLPDEDFLGFRSKYTLRNTYWHFREEQKKKGLLDNKKHRNLCFDTKYDNVDFITDRNDIALGSGALYFGEGLKEYRPAQKKGVDLKYKTLKEMIKIFSDKVKKDLPNAEIVNPGKIAVCETYEIGKDTYKVSVCGGIATGVIEADVPRYHKYAIGILEGGETDLRIAYTRRPYTSIGNTDDRIVRPVKNYRRGLLEHKLKFK